jgi:DNA excision repair protein ERCC-6
MNGLFGINILRKICNHPHLLDKQKRKAVHAMDKEQTKELVQMSGKLRVLEQILPLWKKQGHKILVFTQTRQVRSSLFWLF